MMNALKKMLVISTLLVVARASQAAYVDLKDHQFNVKQNGEGFQDNYLVQQNVGAYGESFSVGVSGEYALSLRDFNFPSRFDELSAEVVQGDKTLGQISLSEDGGATGLSLFNLLQGETYYFSLTTLLSKASPAALYGVDLKLASALQPASVPLPGSLLFLVSGLAGIFKFLRKTMSSK